MNIYSPPKHYVTIFTNFLMCAYTLFHDICVLFCVIYKYFYAAAEPFIIKDKTFEKQRKCSLSASLAKARAGPPLLESQEFFITANVQPAPSEMSDIIRCSGGEVGLVSCDLYCRLTFNILAGTGSDAFGWQ